MPFFFLWLGAKTNTSPHRRRPRKLKSFSFDFCCTWNSSHMSARRDCWKRRNRVSSFWFRGQHHQLANRIGGHPRVPPLLLVVVWQPCTFGSTLINQRARALLCPQRSMWERRHTKDSLISSGRSWEQSGEDPITQTSPIPAHSC